MPKNYLTHPERVNDEVNGHFGMNTMIITKKLTEKLIEDKKKNDSSKQDEPLVEIENFKQAYGYKSADAAGQAGGTVAGYIYLVNPEAVVAAISKQINIIDSLIQSINTVTERISKLDKASPEYAAGIAHIINNQFLLGLVYECEGNLAAAATETELANSCYLLSKTSFEAVNKFYIDNKKQCFDETDPNNWKTKEGNTLWVRRGTPDKEAQLKIGGLEAKIDETMRAKKPPSSPRMK